MIQGTKIHDTHMENLVTSNVDARETVTRRKQNSYVYSPSYDESPDRHLNGTSSAHFTRDHPPAVSAVSGLYHDGSFLDSSIFLASFLSRHSTSEPSLNQNRRFKLTNTTASLPTAVKGLKGNSCAFGCHKFSASLSCGNIRSHSSLKKDCGGFEFTVVLLTASCPCCGL